MTLTEDIRAIVERVKNLGPEWRHTANVLTDALGAAEHAQNARLRYLTTCIDEAKGRLAYHKQEIRTLPEQIAKLEAERAHLESQTGLDPLRAVVAEQSKADKQPGEHVTAAAFDPSRHEGGPDGVLCLHFAGIPAEFFAHHATWETPSGKQMGSADVLALAAREWRPVGTTWAEVKARVMQPTVKPAEDEDPIEKAFWRYCMLIDKTQKTARVKAGYLEAPYPNRDAFKIAVRSTVLGLGVPAASFTPPAPTLLDLTKLPPGTVCEATGQIARGSHVILPGERFAFAGSSTEFLARVRVIERDESFDVPLMVHARVVEVPR